MAIVGFHASHEQIPPSRLLSAVVAAEQAGFGAAMCSDHFSPWSERQGESGYAWSWLGAALQATSLSFGVVTAPGQRYHPAVTAQAMATLAEMFPGRFWAALGTGEASNEHITGDRWPDKPTRNERLGECVDVIRRLLAGEEVTRHGLVTVDRATLWTLPEAPPPLLGAAVSPETARLVGGWGDGLITIHQPVETLRRVIEEFHAGGGAGKPVFVQMHLSYDRDEERALAVAHDQWRSNAFTSDLMWDLELPAQFDVAAKHVRPEDLHDHVLISSDPGRHVSWIEEVLALDVDGVYLHHVGQEQDGFIEDFGENVLPKLGG